jgi:hypothetical protein
VEQVGQFLKTFCFLLSSPFGRLIFLVIKAYFPSIFKKSTSQILSQPPHVLLKNIANVVFVVLIYW